MSGKWLLPAACLLLAACSVEPAQPEVSAKQTIVAGIEGTRVEFNNYKLSWESTDKIFLSAEGYAQSYIFSYARELEGGKAAFEGDEIMIPAPYHAAWPYDCVSYSGGDGFSVYFFREQTVPAGGVSRDHMLLFARGEDELHFRPAVGLLKFTVKDADIKYIDIGTVSGAPLAVNSRTNNGAWIEADTGELRIWYGKSDFIVVLPQEGHFVAGEPYYVAVPPGNYAKGISVTLYNEADQRAYKHSYNTLTVEAGKVTNLGEISAEFDVDGLPEYVECGAPIYNNHYGSYNPYGLELGSTFDLGSCVYVSPSKADQSVGYLSLDNRIKVTPEGVVSAVEPAIGAVKVYSLVKPSCYRIVYFSFCGFKYHDMYFSIDPDDGSAAITNSTYSTTSAPDTYSGTVVVPASVYCNGIEYPVRGVMKYAFENCKNLKKVVLPEGLTYIRVCSFNGCTSLEELNLPASLKDLPDVSSNSFVLDCPKLTITSKAEGFPVDEYGNLYDERYKKELVWLCEKTTGTNVIKEGTTGIGGGDGPLYNSFAKTISFPASLKYDIWVNSFRGGFPNLEEIKVDFATYDEFETVFGHFRIDSGYSVAGKFSRLRNNNSESPSAIKLSVPAAYVSEYSSAVADYGFAAIVTH